MSLSLAMTQMRQPNSIGEDPMRFDEERSDPLLVYRQVVLGWACYFHHPVPIRPHRLPRGSPLLATLLV